MRHPQRAPASGRWRCLMVLAGVFSAFTPYIPAAREKRRLGLRGRRRVKQIARLNGALENQAGEGGDCRIERQELRLHSGRIGLEWRILSDARLGLQHAGNACEKKKALNRIGPGLSLKGQPRWLAVFLSGSPGRTRTANLVVNSHPLCQLSYRGSSKRGSHLSWSARSVKPFFAARGIFCPGP